MDSTITHEHFQLKKNVPNIKPGDRIRVHQKIHEGNKERIQVFEGLVIKTQHGRGINGTFTVRRIASGVGVEKLFPLHCPAIVKIEKIRSAKVRRAKLYYVRGLIGKGAKRLSKEKEDLGVWEDVVAPEEPAEEVETEETENEESVEPEEETEPVEKPAKAEDKTEDKKDKAEKPEKK